MVQFVLHPKWIDNDNGKNVTILYPTVVDTRITIVYHLLPDFVLAFAAIIAMTFE